MSPRKEVLYLRISEDEQNKMLAIATSKGLGLGQWARSALLDIAANGSDAGRQFTLDELLARANANRKAARPVAPRSKRKASKKKSAAARTLKLKFKKGKKK